jgi:hypothetical protein
MTVETYCDVFPLRPEVHKYCSEWRCTARAAYHVRIKWKKRGHRWDFCEPHMLSAVEHYKTKIAV